LVEPEDLGCGWVGDRLLIDRQMFVGTLFHIRAVEVERDDAGNDDDKRNDQLESRGKHQTLLAFREGGGTKDALGDVLVEAPVVEVRDPDAE